MLTAVPCILCLLAGAIVGILAMLFLAHDKWRRAHAPLCPDDEWPRYQYPVQSRESLRARLMAPCVDMCTMCGALIECTNTGTLFCTCSRWVTTERGSIGPNYWQWVSTSSWARHNAITSSPVSGA